MVAVSLEAESIGKRLGDHQQEIEDGSGSEPKILDKQNSILSLTLDEIQFKSGRSFGSMNMEEFIANVWSVDLENHESSPILTLDNHNNNNGVSRQGSFSIPIPICKKTVDEIWVELHRGSESEEAPAVIRQQTLGEMTLEDFLVKAGVVQECTTSTNTTGFGQNSINNNESVNGKMKKKRIIDGPPELAVERRQRRMIKNRESAARSRARKQAYTVELEVELNQLKDENEKLKQVMAEAELKRKQEILMRSQQYSTKLRTIRRALSLGW